MRVSQEESVWSWHLQGNSPTGAWKANEKPGQRASGIGENGLQALLLSQRGIFRGARIVRHDHLLSASSLEQLLLVLAGSMVDGYEPIADDYHLATAHSFKALDLLFALLDLAFDVFVSQQINFSPTIRNRSATAADQPNIVSAETTLVNALVTMLRVFQFRHELSPLLTEIRSTAVILERCST